MFNITYLSTEDRRKIATYQKQSLSDPALIEARNAKIRAIETQAKSYLECTVEELDDLRGQIQNKILTLSRINKPEIAQQFYLMLDLISQQVQHKYLEQRERDKEKKAAKDAKSLEREHRPRPAETKQGRNRWTFKSPARTSGDLGDDI